MDTKKRLEKIAAKPLDKLASYFEKGSKGFQSYRNEVSSNARIAYNKYGRPAVEYQKKKLAEAKQIAKQQLTFKKSISNIKAAKAMIFHAQGIKAFFNPTYIALAFRISMVSAIPALIAVIAFALICYVWLYTMIAPIYFLYAVASSIAAFLNIFLTVANAFLYAVNAIFEIIRIGIMTIIDQLAIWLLKPIATMINAIIGAINTVIGVVNVIANAFHMSVNTIPLKSAKDLIPQHNYIVHMVPDKVFAYIAPPDRLTLDAAGNINLASFFAFVFVRPGAPLYAAENNTIYVTEYAFVSNEPTVALYIPKIYKYARADGFICSPYKPPPLSQFLGFPLPSLQQVNWISVTKKLVDNHFHNRPDTHNTNVHISKVVNVKSNPSPSDLIGPFSGNSAFYKMTRKLTITGDDDHDGIPNWADPYPYTKGNPNQQSPSSSGSPNILQAVGGALLGTVAKLFPLPIGMGGI